MSETASPTAPADEGHHVIKFYRDVGDEVDSHFARALQPSKRPNFLDKSEGFLPVAAVSRPLPPPPLGHPKPALVPSVPDSPTSWPRMPRPKTILFPELAGLLVHPDVDSYSDAPKVPGQPDLSVSPPPFLEYIHCVGEALPLTGLRGYLEPLNAPRYCNPAPSHHLTGHNARSAPFVFPTSYHPNFHHHHHHLSHVYPPVLTHHYTPPTSTGEMVDEHDSFGFSEEDLQQILN